MKASAVLSLPLAGIGITVAIVGTASARTEATSTARVLAMPTVLAGNGCPRGATGARIGGRKRCLRVGQRCDPRFNTTRPSYKRYGFLCTAHASNEPTTLFRIAQPGLHRAPVPGSAGPQPPRLRGIKAHGSGLRRSGSALT